MTEIEYRLRGERLYTQDEVGAADNQPQVTTISGDLHVRIGRASKAVYLSSLSGESTIMIAPDEIPPLIAFLERYMDDQAGRREAV